MKHTEAIGDRRSFFACAEIYVHKYACMYACAYTWRVCYIRGALPFFVSEEDGFPRTNRFAVAVIKARRSIVYHRLSDPVNSTGMRTRIGSIRCHGVKRFPETCAHVALDVRLFGCSSCASSALRASVSLSRFVKGRKSKGNTLSVVSRVITISQRDTRGD